MEKRDKHQQSPQRGAGKPSGDRADEPSRPSQAEGERDTVEQDLREKSA